MKDLSGVIVTLATGLIVASVPLLAGGETNVVPEPGVLGVAAIGLGAMILLARKMRRR